MMRFGSARGLTGLSYFCWSGVHRHLQPRLLPAYEHRYGKTSLSGLHNGSTSLNVQNFGRTSLNVLNNVRMSLNPLNIGRTSFMSHISSFTGAAPDSTLLANIETVTEQRTKRDSLSQDLLALIRYMEAEKASKEQQYPDPRDYLRYYPADLSAREDFNDLLEPVDDEGQWYDPQVPPSHVPREREPLWARPPPHKRFMVAKRRYDDSPLYGQDMLYNYLDGAPSRRRFLI